MEYKLRLIAIGALFFCLLLTSLAPAHSVLKTLYIDGNLVGDFNATDSMLKFATDYLKVGAEGSLDASYNEYVGDMDEFAIYEGVLDPCAIKAHYLAGLTGVNATYEAAIEANNPLLWLRFEENDCNDSKIAYNSGSVDFNGVYSIVGGQAFSKTAGICAGTEALVFPDSSSGSDDGSFVHAIEPDGELSYNVTDGEGGVDISIEVWVRFVDVNSGGDDNAYPRFCSHNGHWAARSAYAVLVNNDPCQIGVIGGNTQDFITGPAPVNDGEWHHIVVTYDSTYVPYEPGTYQYEVKLDDPVLYLRFEEFPFVDDSNNNYWVDSSPLVEMHEQPVGAMGNAAWLGGGWVAAAPQLTEPALPTDFNHAYEWAPDDITVEFWVATPQPEQVDDYCELFTDANTLMHADDEVSPYRWYAGRGAEQGRMALGDEDLQDPVAYTSDKTWKENVRWHHHVLVWDEREDPDPNEPNEIWIEWYRDTISCKNQAYTTDGDDPWPKHSGPEMDHVLFGGYGSRDNFSPGDGPPYGQYIDEIAIYPYALSQTRVEAHYDAWKPRNCQEIWDRMTYTDYQPLVNKPVYLLDVDQDCNISFYDFCRLADDWASCNNPPDIGVDPGCWANWL